MQYEENNVIREAVRIAKQMKNAIAPNEKWIVTTIAKSKDEEFLAPSDRGTQAFGYFYDQVPQLLENEGIFLAKEEWSWYDGITPARNYAKIKEDAITKGVGYMIANPITRYAWEQGYLPPEKEIDLWFLKDRDIFTFTILTTREKLLTFINKYTNLTPEFDETTGEIHFLHLSPVILKGKIKIATAKLLFENLNSIIPLQKLFDIPRIKEEKEDLEGRKRFMPYEKYGKKRNPNDAIDEVCNEIREALAQNSILKNTLRIVYEKNVGYGLIIDQNTLSAYIDSK